MVFTARHGCSGVKPWSRAAAVCLTAWQERRGGSIAARTSPSGTDGGEIVVRAPAFSPERQGMTLAANNRRGCCFASAGVVLGFRGRGGYRSEAAPVRRY
ncbi:hypothetical protein MRX96_010516 [Rhipicephalus microplus]